MIFDSVQMRVPPVFLLRCFQVTLLFAVKPLIGFLLFLELVTSPLSVKLTFKPMKVGSDVALMIFHVPTT